MKRIPCGHAPPPPILCQICRLNPGTQQGDAVVCQSCSNSIAAELDGKPTGRYRLWRGNTTFEVNHVNPGDPAAAERRPDLALVPQQPAASDNPQTPAAPSSPEPATATQPLATVTPLHRTQEDNDMTTDTTTAQSGEITGLESAKAYAGSMAAAYAATDSSVEEFTSSLEGFGVSGEAIAAAAQAAEAQQVAQAAWEQAHAALSAQDVVKEAYESTPGAGSREFVTSE